MRVHQESAAPTTAPTRPDGRARQGAWRFLCRLPAVWSQECAWLDDFAGCPIRRKGPPMTAKSLTILGIETSCDETAAAVVRGRIPGPGEILSNIVFSQTEAHAPYGGVVPEIASRAHLEILDAIIERALDEAGGTTAGLDGVA